MTASTTARTERGSVSIWLVTSTFAMIGLVGLAVDLGGRVHAQQRAHDLAAQAARAGGQEVQAAPAIEGDATVLDKPQARAAAVKYLRDAGANGAVDFEGTDAITVTVTDTYEPQFLTLFGIAPLVVSSEATARVVRSHGGVER